MLNVVTVSEAEKIISDHLNIELCSEQVCLLDSIGRISAQDIVSREDIPCFDRSTVDGYAVCACDTYGCSPQLPAMLHLSNEIFMGQPADEPLMPGTCQKIPTGGMLPSGADAVVMHEYCEDYKDGFIYVGKPCSVYENVTRRGDDVQSNDVIVKRGEVISPHTVGQLASVGETQVSVYKKLHVGIISTGDEIVEYSAEPPFGCVRDINSILLASILTESCCETTIYPIVKDIQSSLCNTVKTAVCENDMVLLSGGSSAGDKDAAFTVLSALGEVCFHGIAVKPGKPTLFAAIENKPVFALPGHPLAAALVCRIFVLPAVCQVMKSDFKPITVIAETKVNIPSDHGREEIVLVSLTSEDEKQFATPIFAKSGVVSALHSASGYIQISRDTEGVNKGEKVKVTLFARQI